VVAGDESVHPMGFGHSILLAADDRLRAWLRE
jgi:hypothetical protein